MKNLVQIFEKYGFCLTKTQENQFEQYYNLLIETNKTMNLTAITEENDVIVKHFLDSVLPEKLIKPNSKIVDVGSGAGFPAIPLKIIRPDLEICMVDSLNKRVNFLNDTIKTLNLPKITAIHSRAEDFAQKNREMFDCAVARAVAETNTLVEYLLPLIKIEGKALLYKSAKLEEELSQSKNAIRVLGGEIESIQKYILPDEIQRNVLIIKKVSTTPKKYPRGQNKPKTTPLN